ncbi:MAG: HPF/RaiA family ribosome-associated protein [Alphaproteobacteria bacterium]|nr:HPF/RaiA family ribosome-associated protein [Alphaproteobacteria bacterium]
MQVPLQITFRHLEPSEAVESQVREQVDRLERHRERITSCRVAIEAIRRKGLAKLFKVRLDITYPRGEVAVARESYEDQRHDGLMIAIRDAFEAAHRTLMDRGERQRGAVKSHEVPPHGVVERLFSDQGYGFVRMPDGQEVYFHRNAVAEGTFEMLAVGTPVRCEIAEGEGVKGAQASTIKPIGSHHLPPVERV